MSKRNKLVKLMTGLLTVTLAAELFVPLKGMAEEIPPEEIFAESEVEVSDDAIYEDLYSETEFEDHMSEACHDDTDSIEELGATNGTVVIEGTTEWYGDFKYTATYNSKTKTYTLEGEGTPSSTCFEDNGLPWWGDSGIETMVIKSKGCESLFSFVLMMPNLKVLDISEFDPSSATSVNQFVSYCPKLTKIIGIEKFNLVCGDHTVLSDMFTNCSSLKELDLSGFDTQKCDHYGGMFNNCTSLESVDLSSFDLRNIGKRIEYGWAQESEWDFGFKTCTKLKTVKSPKYSPVEITLPYAMYDESGKEYTAIPTTDGTSITLHAKGGSSPKPQQGGYTIEFDGVVATGGTTKTMSNLLSGKTYTLSANGFVKEGYTFAGWAEEMGGNVVYPNKAKVTDLGDSGDKVTLYAIWTPNTYTLTVKGNGGYYIDKKTNKKMTSYKRTFIYDDLNDVGYCSFERPGYWLRGLDLNKKATEPGIEDGTTTDVNFTSKNNGNVTAYAIWEPNEIYIVFDENTDSVVEPIEGIMDGVSTKYGTNVALPDNVYSCKGYTFKGWSLSADGKGKLIKNKAKVKNLTTEGEVILYAQWQVNNYSVKFNANQGKITDKKALAVQKNLSVGGTKARMPETGVTKDGQVLAGWNTKADGTGDHYDRGEEETLYATKNKQTITLYAEWKSAGQ